MQLDRLDRIPDALARIGPREIKEVFPHPTLITLPGTKPEPVFVSTLLHGNETTSFEVLQHLQKAYADAPPPRSLIIFIGNVEATAQGQRVLNGQEDFNRIWAHGMSPFHAVAHEVLTFARRHEVFASVDIHNNTGTNPLYGCVNALRPADLQLARLFAPVGVLYRNPPTTQSIAFSQLCPAITVECGKSGDPAGRQAAIDLVETVLRLERFDPHPPPPDALRLFETIGRVVVDPDASIAFGAAEADLCLPADLEGMNFKTMPAGAGFGTTSEDRSPLRVLDEHGADITHEFFTLEDGTIQLTHDATPSMVTPDLQIIRQDCLCYLMRPI